jgi:hypothetical protein
METLIRVYVPLNDIERKALIQLGIAEKRDPRQQAALLIRQQLERLGLLQPASAASKEVAANGLQNQRS